MKKAIFLTAFVSFLMLSCSIKKNAGDTGSIQVFKQSVFDSAYVAIRPAVQVFSIDNSKVSTVKASHGTEILVPANCLVTSNGNKPENVQLEVVEAFSLPEFIASGLVTLSDGKLLLSNGMIFINAKSGGENLRLQEGASLTVSMPAMTNNSGFQLFTGDGSNWTVDSSMTETDYTIPLPLDLLYPDGNNIFWYCITYPDNKNDKYHVYDSTIVSVTNKKYENTLIATDEFYRRIDLLRAMTQEMSYFANKDYYFDDTECEDQKYNLDIWKVYFDHPNRSFKESDSIAKAMYLNYYKTNRIKLLAFFEEVNKHKRSTYYNWTDTSYYFDFRKISFEESYMSVLKFFPPAETKEIKIIDNHGVDPDAVDAFAQLSAKGIDINEINQIMNYNFRRKAMIVELQKRKAAIASKKTIENIYQTTIFSVTVMGWINCDRFFDDPTAGKAVMYASNSSGNRLEFIDCSLVIPDLNVRLSAFPDSAGKWSFTKKDGPYTRLPIGKEAVITGVALQNDSVFFASQKIKITDGLSVGLPMKYISRNNLRDSLESAVKN